MRQSVGGRWLRRYPVAIQMGSEAGTAPGPAGQQGRPVLQVCRLCWACAGHSDVQGGSSPASWTHSPRAERVQGPTVSELRAHRMWVLTEGASPGEPWHGMEQTGRGPSWGGEEGVRSWTGDCRAPHGWEAEQGGGGLGTREEGECPPTVTVETVRQ